MSSPGNQTPEGPKNQGEAVGKCPFCGSADVISGLKVNQSAEVGPIGLAYKAGFLFIGTEQLWVDLCRACGSVIRFFVKDSNRKWDR